MIFGFIVIIYFLSIFIGLMVRGLVKRVIILFCLLLIIFGIVRIMSWSIFICVKYFFWSILLFGNCDVIVVIFVRIYFNVFSGFEFINDFIFY